MSSIKSHNSVTTTLFSSQPAAEIVIDMYYEVITVLYQGTWYSIDRETVVHTYSRIVFENYVRISLKVTLGSVTSDTKSWNTNEGVI